MRITRPRQTICPESGVAFNSRKEYRLYRQAVAGHPRSLAALARLDQTFKERIAAVERVKSEMRGASTLREYLELLRQLETAGRRLNSEKAILHVLTILPPPAVDDSCQSLVVSARIRVSEWWDGAQPLRVEAPGLTLRTEPLGNGKSTIPKGGPAFWCQLCLDLRELPALQAAMRGVVAGQRQTNVSPSGTVPPAKHKTEANAIGAKNVHALIKERLAALERTAIQQLTQKPTAKTAEALRQIRVLSKTMRTQQAGLKHQQNRVDSVKYEIARKFKKEEQTLTQEEASLQHQLRTLAKQRRPSTADEIETFLLQVMVTTGELEAVGLRLVRHRDAVQRWVSGGHCEAAFTARLAAAMLRVQFFEQEIAATEKALAMERGSLFAHLPAVLSDLAQKDATLNRLKARHGGPPQSWRT